MTPFVGLKDQVLSADCELDSTARLVVLAIADRLDGEGVAFMSCADIHARTGLSERTVRRALDRLCSGREALFVRSQPGVTKGVHHRCYRYEVRSVTGHRDRIEGEVSGHHDRITDPLTGHSDHREPVTESGVRRSQCPVEVAPRSSPVEVAPGGHDDATSADAPDAGDEHWRSSLVLSVLSERFRERYGEPPRWTRADQGQLARLAREHPGMEIVQRFERFLADDSEFNRRNGHRLADFCRTWNSHAQAARLVDDPSAAWRRPELTESEQAAYAAARERARARAAKPAEALVDPPVRMKPPQPISLREFRKRRGDQR